MLSGADLIFETNKCDLSGSQLQKPERLITQQTDQYIFHSSMNRTGSRRENIVYIEIYLLTACDENCCGQIQPINKFLLSARHFTSFLSLQLSQSAARLTKI